MLGQSHFYNMCRPVSGCSSWGSNDAADQGPHVRLSSKLCPNTCVTMAISVYSVFFFFVVVVVVWIM